MGALESLKHFAPELTLIAGAFIALFLDFFFKNKKIIGLFCLVLLATVTSMCIKPVEPLQIFHGFFILDGITHFFRYTALGVVFIAILASLSYEPLPKRYLSEYYSLFLFMAFGLILMASSVHLLMIFLAVEFVSILSYLLVGFNKEDAKSKESSVKYLLFGSLASAIMLYGMSLIYGGIGSLNLLDVSNKLSAGWIKPGVSAAPQLFLTALFMILAGIGFKISMAPFHMWAPDVYEGAPTPVTAFLTVAPKALGFAILLRLLNQFLFTYYHEWSSLILILSVITMTIGNVVAVAQNNIKRLLAYSSIAQAGYILMGVAVFTELGVSAVLLYLVAYAFTNLGAFVVVIAASNHFKSDHLESYAGLGKRAPFLAASMTIFLLSLAGIPPFAGFIAKLFVFSGAIEAGYNGLAIAAAVNSAVAAYYYFRIVRVMYLTPSQEESPVPQPWSLRFALYALLTGTIFLGIFPGQLIACVKGIILL